MASLGLRIEGIDELEHFLTSEAPDGIKRSVAESLDRMADEIYDTTTALCPIDTGALVKSIEVTKPLIDQITATAGMDYASYVDNGTRFMEAQPFFEQPINDILLGFTTTLDTMMDEALRK